MNKLLTLLFVGCTAISMAGTASAATAEAKATYKAAKDKADADYKAAKAKCDGLSGNPKDVCKEEADLVKVRGKQEAEAAYKGTAKAQAKAHKEIAEAEYELAKAKCDAQKGNEKDVCVKEAKATYTAAKGDAKVEKKGTAAAVKDANEDKRQAEYKVAKEKCDALAGNAKDACQANAKATFNKS